MGEDGRAVALHMLIEPDARAGLGHDRCERGLAHLKRIAATPPLNRLWKAPARPGLSFVPKLERWRKAAADCNFTRQGADLLRVFVIFFVTDERL
jgi:hypothetical protein